ncbi:MAG: orotidine-5'-phosphate decarboxylase [Bacteroidetes bacterium]|jgi:orotidine-5'-phosphate decarboxylase|nr:orotidine-5'-phosphate decarboxylase [Bacteroidota bacterium]MBX7130324.1 orotidine-5'-phosphate decarboxylase [Flavobacteriales bacterium]MCC6656078.1 orotidine-5'-phosphate decarboxylase [Flavobacteriales bacterium]HMU12716.1 orotidine-5'-phosphate decarboxylase [Flavobacteriales bacterium]HMZ47515.1 orotidine-5'-phosphate decarboxylase [Flavobacteriales bacterium]
MNRAELIALIKRKRNMLCVGLDTELELVPSYFANESHPVRAFNEAIVEATHDIAVAYKLNLAFYEALGVDGWCDLEATIAYIRSRGNTFIIADAKRGDIGNTARKYAEAFYDKLGVDAVTIAPYMGRDSVEPFLGRPGKWGVVLGVTSNDGARDLQFLTVDGGEQRLFERVMEKAASWGSVEDTMFVVGATRAEVLAQARTAAPHHFFLVPGVGAQGGDLKAVLDAGLTADGGLLINSSRGILYAGKDADAIPAARRAALHMRDVMALKLRERGII